MKTVIQFLVICFFICSCKNEEVKEEKPKDYLELKHSYPLVYLGISNSPLKTNIPIEGLDETMNDLVIDTSNQQLWVSFDIVSSSQYVYEARIENYDTFVSLTYYLEDVDSNKFIIRGKEFRVFYSFTDIDSYKKCRFFPQRKRRKTIRLL